MSSTRNPLTSWVLLSCILGGMVFCVLIRPHGLRANDGISYYGTFASTMLPYAMSLLGLALFLSVRRTSSVYPAWIRRIFIGFSAVTIGILLTPYTVNSVFNALHIALGSTLFAGQLMSTAFLALKKSYWYLYVLWILELIAGIMCAIYLSPPKGYLFEWQFGFQCLFICFILLYERPRHNQGSSQS